MLYVYFELFVKYYGFIVREVSLVVYCGGIGLMGL